MTEMRSLSQDELEFNDAPQVAWFRVADVYLRLLEGNPKLHNLQAVKDSIARYGLQELPKYDSQVGIKAGNGRVEALRQMEEEGAELPRGLALDREGRWVMPVLVGVDAESRDAALAYAVDSNNVGLLNEGGFTQLEIARLYDVDSYRDWLMELPEEELPVSMTPADMSDLLAHLEVLSSGNGRPEFFDASKLPDAPAAQGEFLSHIVYVTLPDRERFVEVLRLLSLDGRATVAPGQRYATLDGVTLIDRWRELLSEEFTDEAG